MRKRLSCILLLTGLSVLFGHAQTPAFKVLATRGHVQMKEGGQWTNVKVGASLRGDSEVKVAEHAYVGLIHATGKPLELMKSGHYKVSELARNMKQGDQSAMEKYTDFLLASEKRRRNRLSATGAVHRGNEQITVFLPSTSANLLGSAATIFWKSKHHSAKYQVVLTDMFGNELRAEEVDVQQYAIDFSKDLLREQNTVAITIKSSEHPSEISDTYYIKRLGSAEKSQLNQKLSELVGSFDSKTYLSSLLESAFYEENDLPVEAIMAMHESEPGSQHELFKESLHDLLRRYGIKHE